MGRKQAMAVTMVVCLLMALAACSPRSTHTIAPTKPPINQPTPTDQPTSAPPEVIATGSSPDLIFYNGVILTMRDSPEQVEALALSGEKILAMGSEAEILPTADSSTVMVDLEGRTLMPGFVDPHTHLFNDAGYLDTDLVGAQELALSNGITTLANMFSPQEFVEQMRAFNQGGELIVRTSLYLTVSDNCGNLTGDWWKAYSPTRIPGERLRIGGLKVFADGGTCGHAAFSRNIFDDYAGGELFFTQAEMNALFAEADDLGYQLAVHAIGDLAVEQVLNAMGTVIQDGENPLRFRIEHNSLVRPEQRPLYSEYDAVATLFGYHEVCDFPEATPFYQDLGEDLRGMLDANPGGHFAWHGDDPWIPPISPLIELASMVTREEPDGEGGFCQPPAWMAEKAITVEEGLKMMTTEAAYALFREWEVGSLAPGMYADMVILDGDPTRIPSLQLWDLHVLATLVGGEFVYCSEDLASYCDLQPDEDQMGEIPTDEPIQDTAVQSLRASKSLPDFPVKGAVDGNHEDSPWMSGEYAPQWIEFDLGEVRSVSALRLWVDQDPQGFTRHIIYGGPEPNPTEQIALLEGVTRWGQMLEVTGPWSLRYLRIETVESPSWVGWLEIEIDSE
jgi:predicted amidohydrolase YtcJ